MENEFFSCIIRGKLLNNHILNRINNILGCYWRKIEKDLGGKWFWSNPVETTVIESEQSDSIADLKDKLEQQQKENENLKYQNKVVSGLSIVSVSVITVVAFLVIIGENQLKL